MSTFVLSRTVLVRCVLTAALAAALAFSASAQTNQRPRPTAAVPARPSHRGSPPSPTIITKLPKKTPEDRARDAEERRKRGEQIEERQEKRRTEEQQRAEQAAKPAPFNAAQASSADKAWRSFVNIAKGAGSLQQLLPYLPQSEAQRLKERQSAAAADNRERFKLDYYRLIGQQFIDVLSVKVKDNNATLIVSTRSEATSNGETFPYGKATVEMVGEGNSWRVARYNDSNVHYKEVPTRP